MEKYLQSNRKDGIARMMAGQRRGSSPCKVDRFEEQTDFPEWNTAAEKLNNLISTINKKVQLDALPERSMEYSSSSSLLQGSIFRKHTKLVNRWIIRGMVHLRTMEPWRLACIGCSCLIVVGVIVPVIVVTIVLRNPSLIIPSPTSSPTVMPSFVPTAQPTTAAPSIAPTQPLVCPAGYTLESSMRSCYKYHTNAYVYWASASSQCTQEGGWLVTIDSAEENALLLQRLQSFGISSAWIGLNDISQPQPPTWTWVHPRSPTNTYTNWSPGNPPTYNNGYNCGLFNSGYWMAYQCQNSAISFICEFNNISY